MAVRQGFEVGKKLRRDELDAWDQRQQRPEDEPDQRGSNQEQQGQPAAAVNLGYIRQDRDGRDGGLGGDHRLAGAAPAAYF